MRVPKPREALGQGKPQHSRDPDSNRQEVSEADRTKASSLNSFYPLGKCGSQLTLFESSDYFQFKFLTLFPLILTSSLWVQIHPKSWDQQGSRAQEEKKVPAVRNKPHHHTETAEVPEAAQVSLVCLESPTYQQLNDHQGREIRRVRDNKDQSFTSEHHRHRHITL